MRPKQKKMCDVTFARRVDDRFSVIIVAEWQDAFDGTITVSGIIGRKTVSTITKLSAGKSIRKASEEALFATRKQPVIFPLSGDPKNYMVWSPTGCKFAVKTRDGHIFVGEFPNQTRINSHVSFIQENSSVDTVAQVVTEHPVGAGTFHRFAFEARECFRFDW